MKKHTMLLCATLMIAMVALCTSCDTDEPNIPAGNTSSKPLTFEEMNSFRSMDQSAIIAMMESKGYRTYYGCFINGNEEVHFEYNGYEILGVSYSCHEEGALSNGRMKSLFTDALNDAKAFCEDFILDSTAFYAMVNEERTNDVHTEEELLAFIDNCDRSVMNYGYARFYCQGFTILIHFIGDNLDKSIEWNPTPRYTFNGTTWNFHSVFGSGSTIDLGDGLYLKIRDKIEFKSDSSGIYTYHRIVSYSDPVHYIGYVINTDSVALPFAYSTEMLYDNEGFNAHISQLENIGIEQFSTRTPVSQGVGFTDVYMPEIEEEVTLLFSGSLNTIDAR